VATAEQLKALLRSHAAGDDDRFRSIAMQIAAHAARKGNAQLASDLKRLVEELHHTQSAAVAGPRAVPIARPAGELNGLIAASYPNTRLSDMVLPAVTHARLNEVIHQYRQRDRLRSHGLVPKRRLLLIGPPGCGKTMTASALAGECRLPLMFVQLHSLITRYMGETAAKLHLVFEAMAQTPGVYLFDEFDAIGATRSARNDVGEIRRVLNSFLQLLERDESDSIIVAATNLVGMLDDALFRRFDDVIQYDLANAPLTRTLIQNRLGPFDIGGLKWPSITKAAKGLSPADIARATDEAAKQAVLSDARKIDHAALLHALNARQKMHSTRVKGK
jgi:SpoVK/Ycf46/Vps4 family AAA+-type ATPase